MTPELLKAVGQAIDVAEPDETEDMNAIVPAAVWRKVVDAHAALLYERARLTESAPGVEGRGDVAEAFERTIVAPLRGRYDEKQRVADFAMFSLGYNATPPTDALVEALRLILPMAKGYAAAHPVGSNAEYIRIAEEALPKDGQTPQSGKKEEELIEYEVRSFRGPAHSGYYEVAVSTRDRAHAEQVFAQECERSLYVKLIEVSTRRRVLLVAPSPPASKAEGTK